MAWVAEGYPTVRCKHTASSARYPCIQTFPCITAPVQRNSITHNQQYVGACVHGNNLQLFEGGLGEIEVYIAFALVGPGKILYAERRYIL